MYQQAVLIPLGRQDRVLSFSAVPGLAVLTEPVGECHSIHAEGAMVQISSGRTARLLQQAHETEARSGLSIDASIMQESFQIETHVGLHYNRGYSQ